MTAVNLKTLLTKANRNNYSVAGLVVISWEDAIAYTEAAHETKIPIILQAGPSCRQYTPVSILGKMFRHLAEQTKTPICCHLDHGFSYDECIEGIESGFTSVMFDGSKLPLNKNIKISSKISNIAHKHNISVEGEVGIVGYHNGNISFGTDIEDYFLKVKNFFVKNKNKYQIQNDGAFNKLPSVISETKYARKSLKKGVLPKYLVVKKKVDIL